MCDPVGVAAIRRFQDLECHKLAVQIRREVIRLTARAPVCTDFKFVGQIRDAARGGPRNIAEGFSRFNPAEILQFLSYAQASLDETQDHTMDAHECGYFSDDESEAVLTLIKRTLGAIRNWREYLESPAARRFYERHKARRRTGSKWSNAETSGTESSELKNPEPRNPEPKNPEPKNPEPKNPEPKNPEPKNPEPRNPEPRNREPRNREPRNPEPNEP
jgi:four helix bundle protein